MSLDKSKTDFELGRKVEQYLIRKKVATPTTGRECFNEGIITEISKDFENVLKKLGLDLEDDSLKDTPKRVAKMYVNEIFWGLLPENFPKITTVQNKMRYDNMLIERNIGVSSHCEHHLVGIVGSCHIAYIPAKKIIGLSKFNRVVEYFSKRPQIQERLTEQIYYALSFVLETEDIAVVVEAEHYCVKSRGVEDINSDTITSKMGGKFMEDSQVRAEYLTLIKS